MYPAFIDAEVPLGTSVVQILKNILRNEATTGSLFELLVGKLILPFSTFLNISSTVSRF